MSYIREYHLPRGGGGGGTYNYAGTKITLRLSFKVVEKKILVKAAVVLSTYWHFFLNLMV